MLIRLIISNFLSFNEETEFNMLTGNFKIHKQHVTSSNNIDLLKCAAIYGANGSGKSNLIKSVEYLKNVVTNKDDSLKKFGNKCFKLDDNCSEKPTTIEVEFITQQSVFSYGLSTHNSIIVNEYLYRKNKDLEEELIFERKIVDGKKRIIMDKQYTTKIKDKYFIELYEEELLEDTKTFLSQASGKRFKEIGLAYNWFAKNLFVIFPESKYLSMLANIMGNTQFREFITEIIKNADTGIHEVNSKEIPFDTFFGDEEKDLKENILRDIEDEETAVVLQKEDSEVYISKSAQGLPTVNILITKHPNKNGQLIDFDITEESDGSRRLLDIVPSIDLALNQDVTFFIDEINRSMHPSLTKELISLFLSNKNSKGQIIFTTHDSNLLDLKLFRQDEIWFTEKKKDGSTAIYPLSDFKPRYDLDIKKGYLQGRFGAIPFLASLKDLNW